MLTLYENEIKKRWDQRAQITNKFKFTRNYFNNSLEEITLVDSSQ